MLNSSSQDQCLRLPETESAIFEPMTKLSTIDPAALSIARNRCRRFIDGCRAVDGKFQLTPRSDSSAYALCFAIFGYQLLQVQDVIEEYREEWDRMLRHNLCAQHKERSRVAELTHDKAYLQLLTFTLSALKILGTLDKDPLAEVVLELLPVDIECTLREARVLEGMVRSGNYAMFLGVLLLHVRDYLFMDTQPSIDCWVKLHLGAMNRFGFWKGDHGMTHLQFQNGYHQHEILEYLGIENPRANATVTAVRSLADAQGHFAPYPGGGGCYDYDAVFMLTPGGRVPDAETRAVLERTATTLMSEQRPDGGFVESLYVRPRSMPNLQRFVLHIKKAAWDMPLFLEHLRYGLTLQRPKHDRIHTHWSRYSREWGESDLWDSWFRMLTLARIEVALDPDAATRWGFIDYPGIGYHPILRKQIVAES